MRSHLIVAGVLLSSWAWSGRAGADTPAPVGTSTLAAAAPERPARPAPYSLPWQLRPAMPVSVIRSDTSVASYDTPEGDGTFTVASFLLASVKLRRDFSPFVRVGVVGNKEAVGITNLATGGTLAVDVHPDVRLALFAGFALPVGSGGGDGPDAKVAAAERSGVLARSAMDNAMFAVNDFTFFPGIDVAYVAHGLTVQLEATMLSLIRARGAAVQPDTAKINFTSGLHVGYFFLPELSLGADLRYQAWLSTPAPVAADKTGDSRENVTFAVGPRFHVKVGKTTWTRPGVSYSRGLDLPMSKLAYNLFQIDVPFVF